MHLLRAQKDTPFDATSLPRPSRPRCPPTEECVGLTLKEFSALLKRDDFLGIGEGYWTRVIEGEERILKQASLALGLRKRIDGHAAGARGEKLSQYLLTGITSCHESTTTQEAIEKLRSGVYVMIREGFVRQELKELAGLKDTGVDFRRVLLVSDCFDGAMLREKGYMDHVVRRAINVGFSPTEAIKMATINPADYLGLRHLGAIAPLRHADILFLRDMKDISIEKVMANGEIVYSGNRYLRTVDPYPFPDNTRRTLSIGRFKEEDFRVKARKSENRIRVIDIVNETIMREMICTARVRDGYLQPDVEKDIIRAAVINRKTGKYGQGFIRGTGIKSGALATTSIWTPVTSWCWEATRRI